MSNINEIIYLTESINNKSYRTLRKMINAGDESYKAAIQAHMTGDSHGFMQNMAKHRHVEHQIHTLLGQPTFLQGGQHIQNRQLNSLNYNNSLLSR